MRHFRHLWAAATVFLLALACAAPAFATGGIHIEWMRGSTVYSSETITSSGASSSSGAAPDMAGPGSARITVTAGAVVVICGKNPTATQTNGIRLQAGMDPVSCAVSLGDKVAIIEATDAPATIATSGGGGGGGGGAATVADGADVTQGAKADAKSTATDTTAITIMQVLKEISYMEQNPATQTVVGSGTFNTNDQGNVASGGSDNGNPVKTGCVYNSSPPTFTTGQRSDSQCNSHGAALVDGSAVTQPASIADGSLVTLGAKTDAKATNTDATSITIMQVLKEISAMEQAPASRAVTNAGTFADQATLQTQTDTVMVGGVNLKEINGVAPLMGTGASGTGAQRHVLTNDYLSTATTASSITTVSNTPTISTSAYVSGYVLGGIQSFAAMPTTGILQNASINYKTGSFSGQVDLLIFNANPAGGGTTDHAAAVITTADTFKLVGILHVADCTVINAATMTTCTAMNQAMAYTLAASGTTIFVVAVVRGTPTFGGTTDAQFTLNVVR